ncbi:MAG TPA: hypothetical protein ENK09_01305 [Nitrospirae bacterium]|nr:hypothetical protein [Nitrospirota bacterium]
MTRTYMWIVIIVVMAFLGFMIGYAVPPFMEVGFGKGAVTQEKALSEEELQKQFEELYQMEEGGGSEAGGGE